MDDYCFICLCCCTHDFSFPSKSFADGPNDFCLVNFDSLQLYVVQVQICATGVQHFVRLVVNESQHSFRLPEASLIPPTDPGI